MSIVSWWKKAIISQVFKPTSGKFRLTVMMCDAYSTLNLSYFHQLDQDAFSYMLKKHSYILFLQVIKNKDVAGINAKPKRRSGACQEVNMQKPMSDTSLNMKG